MSWPFGVASKAMTRSAIWYLCVSLAEAITVTCGTTAARAQTAQSGVEAWTSMFVAVPIGDRLEMRADGIFQITDAVSRVGWELARVLVVVRLNDRLSVGGGYTGMRASNETGSHSVEHRAVQELGLRVPIGMNPVGISLRTRLEERRRNEQLATAFRLRQQTRLDLPLGTRGVRAVAWNECFFAINGTEWS